MALSKSVSSSVCAIDGESDVGSCQGQTEQDELQEEPTPATAFLLCILIRLVRALAVVLGGASGATWAVQVLGLNLDDVVVVGKLASFGRETEVGDTRELDAGDIEAGGPLVFLLVHQFDLERLLLEVGDTGFGGDVRVTESTCLQKVSRGQRLNRQGVKRTEQPASSLALPSWAWS